MTYLLRHAQSRPSPNSDEANWPLSEAGKQQARALTGPLASLEIDLIYSSPYQRAFETVRPFAEKQGFAIRVDERLRERKLTSEWLKDHAQAVRRVWKDFDLELPGGESSAECQERMTNVIGDLVARHPSKRLLLSSHGNAVGLYLNSIDPEFDFREWQKMQMPDLFEVDGDQWKRLASV